MDNIAFKVSSVILLSISLILSLVIGLYFLITQKKSSFFQLIVVFQIINALYMIYRMTLYSATEDCLSLNAIPLTLVSNIILYGIDLINLQTLGLFCVLDSRITPSLIMGLRILHTALFVWCEVVYIVNWVMYGKAIATSVVYLVI